MLLVYAVLFSLVFICTNCEVVYRIKSKNNASLIPCYAALLYENLSKPDHIRTLKYVDGYSSGLRQDHGLLIGVRASQGNDTVLAAIINNPSGSIKKDQHVSLVPLEADELHLAKNSRVVLAFFHDNDINDFICKNDTVFFAKVFQ